MAYIHFFQSHSYPGPSSRKTQGEKYPWICLILLESNLSDHRGNLLSFRDVGSVELQGYCSCCHHYCRMTRLWRAGGKKDLERKTVFFHILYVLEVPFSLLKAELEGFSLSFFNLCHIPTSLVPLLNLRLCWDCGILKEKNLLNSPLVRVSRAAFLVWDRVQCAYSELPWKKMPVLFCYPFFLPPDIGEVDYQRLGCSTYPPTPHCERCGSFSFSDRWQWGQLISSFLDFLKNFV